METFDEETEQNVPINSSNFIIKFSFVKLQIVRDFLHSFMKDVRVQFPYDLERVIDDFVLLCFLVGNDFLPHLPGLDIRMGGIDILLAFYKKVIVKLKGYLTLENEINLVNFEAFLKDLGRVEFELLKRIEDIQYKNMGLKESKVEINFGNATKATGRSSESSDIKN